MNKPYIGVTDFTSRTQVERAKLAITGNRRLHVGVMTSYKVQHRIPTTKGWENVWLSAYEIQKVFTNDPDVYNVIHYADYDHTDHARAPTSVLDLVKTWDMCGPFVNAIQLDMVWPRISMLEEFLHCRPQAEIILQVSTKAIAALKRGFWEDESAKYKHIINYVLVDTGMGQGVTFDPEEVLYCLQYLTQYYPQSNIAIAGGLGPETYQNMKPILDVYPNISCDAQGRLRPTHNALDPLDMGYVERYVKGICSLLPPATE